MDKLVEKPSKIQELEHKSRLQVYFTLLETIGASVVSYTLVKNFNNVLGNLTIIAVSSLVALVSNHGINKINYLQNEINNLEQIRQK